jgi:L-alanine-DL-glutamate epimerase-like enolase superfamily enzyme
MRPTDVKACGTELYFIPVEARLPLKFGKETVSYVTCARVRMKVKTLSGKSAEGWGETPLSVTWAWPSQTLSYEERHTAMKDFCVSLAKSWASFDFSGHALELGREFIETEMERLLRNMNQMRKMKKLEPMPHLAALICSSLFDIALHDAYGKACGLDVYKTYNKDFMSKSLADLVKPAAGSKVSFKGKYPEDFFPKTTPKKLPVWHLVGGVDLIDKKDATGAEPKDGWPFLLEDWIKTDGLKCLKIKLRGNDSAWDYDRIVKVGKIARRLGAPWLTTDFNCTVTDPAYVNEILDKLVLDEPDIYGMLLYVEQPFPYDLKANQIDVHSVSARKPLFMDESAHDWKYLRMGRRLGWTGVALKTCKTQTGALLSLCWAKAHGMTLMVQDLTNPMLAMIPHVRLAAHAGTIMGVESNAMQFYPAASAPEAKVHPGLYQRRNGVLDLSTISGNGFGYRLDKIKRELPKPAAEF